MPAPRAWRARLGWKRLGFIGLLAASALLGRRVEFLGPLPAQSRCASGLIALGPRCCGQGQHLEGDRCRGTPLRCAEGMEVRSSGCVLPEALIVLAGGTLDEQPSDWEADGLVLPRRVLVPPFRIDRSEVSEARYEACAVAGVCPSLEGSGEPGRAAAGVTFEEARLFCEWAGGALPSSEQLAFAAASSTSRRYPWGAHGAVCRRAAFGLVDGPCGSLARGPDLCGAHPDGSSPEGLVDLAGNVGEWAQPSTLVPLGWAEVRGGSFADGEAAALKSWHRRERRRTERSSEVGFRCVYAP